ncbi:Protein of unknown function [Hymenobacter psychrotolerans DSM 18569]|uniref:DUF2931 family protein n=2 Tax=Hymenobacter psychrotolerans TaxID=344998 RepID=A0A1M7G6S7_9BACT|nr:Protein of unknown function [Hymenobacter psychrotolerans DSM 18569]
MSDYQTDKFRLSASPCAAKGYPMTIQFGAFVRSDGKTFKVPSGHTLEGSWGNSSIGWAVGDEFQPAPEKLEILYFSYLEDTFYEGTFALPQQRLHELLQAGFWDLEKKQHTTYTSFTVCVLPKGAVVVWLVGAGRQVLVGRYQAAASTVDFRRFYPKSDRVNMLKNKIAAAPSAVQAQLKAGTLSPRQWDEYLKTYSWHVALPQFVTLYNYRVNFLSAEYTSSPDTQDMAPYLRAALTPQARPLPAKFSLYVTDEAGHKYSLKTDFDEAETQAVFQQLHQAHPAGPITLHIETDKYVKAATLVLESGGQRIPLTKSPVRIIALK